MLGTFRFFAVATVLVSLTTSSLADESTITVQGTAEKRVAADFGLLTFQIEARDRSSTKALERANSTTAGIREFLEEQGVSESNFMPGLIMLSPILPPPAYPVYSLKSGSIQAPNYQSSNPQLRTYPVPNSASDPFGEGDEQAIAPSPKPIGYVAGRSVQIKITNLQNLEAIRNGLVERGVSSPDNFQFHAKDAKEHGNAVRILAVRNAREKAEMMASELGATLATVRTMRESNTTSDRGMIFPSADPFADASVPSPEDDSSSNPRTIRYASNVEIVFTLGGTELKPIQK